MKISFDTSLLDTAALSKSSIKIPSGLFEAIENPHPLATPQKTLKGKDTSPKSVGHYKHLFEQQLLPASH